MQLLGFERNDADKGVERFLDGRRVAFHLARLRKARTYRLGGDRNGAVGALALRRLSLY